MDDKKVEELTLLATSIALCLVKDKTKEEVCDIKFIVTQISSTLTTICGLKK